MNSSNYFLGILFAISTTALVLAILAFTKKKNEGYRGNLTSPDAPLTTTVGKNYAVSVGGSDSIENAANNLVQLIKDKHGSATTVGGMSCSQDTPYKGTPAWACVQALSNQTP